MIQVRGAAWVVPKLRKDVSEQSLAGCGFGADYGNHYELHCMTSATLIEALYDAVDEWIAMNAPGKKSIHDFTEKDSWDSWATWGHCSIGCVLSLLSLR